jgi:hypothetical protein
MILFRNAGQLKRTEKAKRLPGQFKKFMGGGIQTKGSLRLWERNHHHRAYRNTGATLCTVRLKTAVRIIAPSLQSSSPLGLKLNGYDLSVWAVPITIRTWINRHRTDSQSVTNSPHFDRCQCFLRA